MFKSCEKFNFSILSSLYFLCVLFQFESAFGSQVNYDDILNHAIGGSRSVSQFENNKCSVIVGEFNRIRVEQKADFFKRFQTTDCSRSSITKIVQSLDRDQVNKAGGPESFKGRALTLSFKAIESKKIQDRIKACWDELDKYRKFESELINQLANAARARAALYDVNNLVLPSNGASLLSEQCRVFSSREYNNTSSVPKTFTKIRREGQSDLDFIRDHSISCTPKNLVLFRPSDFQKELSRKGAKYIQQKYLYEGKSDYSFTNQIQNSYKSPSDFIDRQICQSLITEAEDLAYANEIKPPPPKKDQEPEPKKENERICGQFDHIIKCDKLREGQTIQVMIGWPSCVNDVIENCAKERGITFGGSTPAHGESVRSGN